MSTQLSLLTPPRPRSRRSYHVSHALPGSAVEAAEEIKAGERKASKQDAAVLEFFRSNPGRWSPSQVWEKVCYTGVSTVEYDNGAERHFRNYRWPLTSIRRAISNAAARGHLAITMDRVTGPFGSPEHCWELSEVKP